MKSNEESKIGMVRMGCRLKNSNYIPKDFFFFVGFGKCTVEGSLPDIVFEVLEREGEELIP